MGTTPSVVGGRSTRSRRSSMSSFVSELDERFHLHADGMGYYPHNLEAASTDPRMIQAITQTMIGEYLWKYTRKAGSGQMSNKRHRRFFWVHPYTRTLYWSEQDPATAGRAQLKAKSVQIEAVRVVQDDNPMPPGLHRKSLIVLTPSGGRDLKFTAPTGQRHETWFNSLSYLLLRQSQDARAQSVAEHQGFNPTTGLLYSARQANAQAGSAGPRAESVAADRVSLSTYNSRNTTRLSRASSVNANGSPTRGDSRLSTSRQAGVGESVQGSPATMRRYTAGQSSAAQDRERAGLKSSHSTTGAGAGTGAAIGRHPSHMSMSSRISSVFRPGWQSASSVRRDTGIHGTDNVSGIRGGGQDGNIYDASVVAHDSAEDLRGEYAAREEDSERLENVRACCDGRL